MVKALYPFTSHYLDLDGLRYHYLDEGRGDPVIMLHGNPTWSFYYRDLVRALRDGYRTIVPDHIGCGLSEKPDDCRYEYTLGRRVEDLEHLLEHLAIRRDITLVVHDWGGMIGMAYATRHPDRIARIVLLNTAAFHLPQRRSLPWALKVCRSRLWGPLLVRGLNLFSRSAVHVCCRTRRMPAEIRHAYLSPYDSWRNRIAVLRFVQDIPLAPEDTAYAMVTRVQKALGRLRHIPVLICWGDRDFVFDHHCLDAWLEYFPEATLHRFPEAGHYVMEDAGDRIIPIVEQFLRNHALQTASP